MELSDILQSERTFFLIKHEDLTEFAEKVANRILAGQAKSTSVKPEIEQPISQAQAIIFLGKSRQTLISWRKKGLINAYRLGGRIYYKPSELVSALEKFK